MSHTGQATGEAGGREKADIAQNQKKPNCPNMGLANFLKIKFISMAKLSTLDEACPAHTRGILLPQKLWTYGRDSTCCSLLSFMCSHAFYLPSLPPPFSKKQKQNCIFHVHQHFFVTFGLNVDLKQQYISPFLTANFSHKKGNTRV